MAKKTEIKTETLEREYIIPLRKEWAKVPRYKRANKAIKAIKEFLVRHMKIRDRDLKKIKINSYLNEEIWFRGIKKPPIKIKVKAIKEGEIVKADLVNYPEKLKFKKLREEKRESKAKEIVEGKKKSPEKIKEQAEKTEEKIEEKKEAEEKKAAVIEAGEKMQKETARKAKHEMIKSAKQPKRQQRVALQK